MARVTKSKSQKSSVKKTVPKKVVEQSVEAIETKEEPVVEIVETIELLEDSIETKEESSVENIETHVVEDEIKEEETVVESIELVSEEPIVLEPDYYFATPRETYEKYKFFWKGNLSQWAKSTFTQDGITFECAEQYMMYYKAVLMNDKQTGDEILKSKTPKEQKDLGRKIRNFNQNVWDANKVQIVYNGNYLKFTQNPKLLDELLATDGLLLVEASPFDNIWGIAMDEETASRTFPENWKGENLLGRILTKLREDLKK